MSELFPLNAKDIEAVAKSRINRAEGNKSTFYIGLAMVLILAGIFIAMTYLESQWIGWLVSVAGVGFLLVYMYRLGKRQSAYKIWLLQEWHEEQAKGKK